VSENLDLVRSIFADWERGDFGSAEWAHPEIAFVMVGEGPDSGSWTGVSAWMEWRDDFLSAWAEVRVEADEYRELDGERVLVLGHVTGRGRASGLELRGRGETAVLFHVRDGKVTRQVSYLERDRAFADLGLTPQGEAT
jgi:ketosteroid isomerase-like protein